MTTSSLQTFTVSVAMIQTPEAGTAAVPTAAAAPSTHDTLGTGAPTAAGAVTGVPLGAPIGGPAPAQPPMGGLLWIMVAMLVFMIGMSVMSSRRERKKRDTLMSSLSKHDKVLTVGGILGTVAEVRETEVVLIIDESKGTRIRVTRNSIQQIMESAAAAAADSVVNGSVQTDIKVKAKGERAAV